MFEFMKGGRSAVVDNEGKQMSAFAQSAAATNGKNQGRAQAGGKTPPLAGKPTGAGGSGGKQDVGDKSIKSMEQTIADAKGGDKDAKAGLEAANKVLLKHEQAARAKQIKQLGGKGGK